MMTLTPPVRVAFLIDALGRAGTESQLLALLQHLDRRRIEPSLVLLGGDDPLSHELTPDNVPTLRLGVKKLLAPATVQAAARFVKFLEDQDVDLLVCYFLDSTYFGALLARLAGVRRVVRVRNNLGYWLTPKHRFFNRIAGVVCDATLTNSVAGAQALSLDERLPERKLVVIENGVDLERFTGARLPFSEPGTLRIGCTANLRPVKNIEGLIRAARTVIDHVPHAEFEVAGEGELRPSLEELITKLGLTGRFHLRGAVADVPEFLKRLDVAILPSHSEGMSNALLEYMAAGRPIVATDVGANARLLEGGRCGIIVPAGSDSSLSQAVLGYAQDPVQARLFGQRARSRAESEYGRTAMRRRFEDLFHALVRKSR